MEQSNHHHQFAISAAGGNVTAIRVLKDPLDRVGYERDGTTLLNEFASQGAEQAGFLIPASHHFEMSGGEFCGNATRAAAVIFHKLSGEGSVRFTVSGFAREVTATVESVSQSTFNVQCVFPGMAAEPRQVTIGAQVATIVDLGGIVHVIVDGQLPEDYEQQHRKIMTALKLQNRDAVGVIWVRRSDGRVYIEPVVWVRAIDTFFHETSCGSGSIAVAASTGQQEIVQPSGETITVTISASGVELQSEMEVLSEAA